MNKSALLTYLEEKDFVAEVFEPTEVEETQSVTRYEVSFFEVVGTAGTLRTCEIYVANEGAAEELAVFRGEEPTQEIVTNNALLIQYAAEIASVKGKVLESNENYIVVEAYQTVGEVTSKVIYVADADEIKVLTQ